MELHVFKRTLYNFTCDLGWCYQKLVSIRLTEQSERPEKASFLKQSVLPKTSLVWGNPWLLIQKRLLFNLRWTLYLQASYQGQNLMAQNDL